MRDLDKMLEASATLIWGELVDGGGFAACLIPLMQLRCETQGVKWDELEELREADSPIAEAYYELLSDWAMAQLKARLIEYIRGK